MLIERTNMKKDGTIYLAYLEQNGYNRWDIIHWDVAVGLSIARRTHAWLNQCGMAVRFEKITKFVELSVVINNYERKL
jgi:hypothetical protein